MTNPSNLPNGPTVSAAWADNMSLDTLVSVLGQNTLTAVSQQQSVDSQRFWATPMRPASDSTKEVLQITLTSPRLVNQVIFDVAIFPQVVALEYFDDAANAWSPTLTKSATSPVTTEQTVLNSYPLVLPPVTNVTGHVHPQHSFSGHWKTLEFNIRPVVARMFRVLLQRSTRGTSPVSVFGVLVDYSLAVRNFYVGYQIASADDIPLSSPFTDAVTAAGTFASTTDFLGSVVNFSVHTDSATNVLFNQNSTSSGAIWKCEPQPFPWAVVNFYIDARDSVGNPQVIDRFYTEPLYDGPSCHLYYSNDDVTTTYEGTTTPLPPEIAVVHNPQGVGGDVLHAGAAGLNMVTFVDIDNKVLSFDPGHTWWIGASLNFKFPHGAEITDAPIVDCGVFNIALTPFGIRCSTAYGDTVAINIGAFDPATPMVFLVNYDGTNLTINVRVGQVRYSGTMAVSVPLTASTVTSIRVGGFQGTNPGLGNFDLNDFVLKTDDVPDSKTITDFLSNPEPYVAIANFRTQTDSRTDNALLRYHQNWSTPDFPAGFVGGESDHYAELHWSPIARDYVLRKGFLDFPPTKAKYWKFEFTGLIPESYEVYQPISRTVKTFPMSMWNLAEFSLTPSQHATTSPLRTSIYQVNNNLTAAFDTFSTSIQTGTGAAALGLNPTQARVIWDSASRQNVGAAYWAWNFLPLHAHSMIPSFTSEGVHTYEKIVVNQTTKLAYFVGLTSVVAYRLDALAVDDNPRYVDNFYDMVNIASDTNWVLLGDHQLTSGTTPYAVMQSKPMASSRVVQAVQFAAQQSDPNQLLPDSDFDDPVHLSWTTVGDALLAPGITTDITVGNTIQVSRATAAMSWDLVALGYPQWHNITDLNLSFTQLETAVQNSQFSGGISSGPMATPAGGRVSVAARVIAPKNLSAPLWVQVVDSATDTVLSEEPVTVKAHQVTEWFTSYTIGDVPTPPWLWRDFTSSTTHALFVDSFHQPDGSPLAPMDSGQIWGYKRDNTGAPLSLSNSSNRAVVTATGQSNFVDVNAVWGTLEFAVGAMGTAPSNIVTNSSFETDTSGWTAIGTLSRVAGGSPAGGSWSARVTSTNAGANTSISNSALFTGLTAGTAYYFSADVMTSLSSQSFQLVVGWYDNTNTLIIGTFASPVVSPVAANTWFSMNAVHIAPPGAVSAFISVQGGSMAVNATFNTDNIFFGLYRETMLSSFGPLFLDDLGTLNEVSGSQYDVATTNVLTTTGAPKAIQPNDDIRIDILPTYLVPGARQDINRSANPDPVAWPYSLMFYLNGTWVRTISHDRGARSLMAIKGRLNQQFASWSWTPFGYGDIPGAVIMYFPRLDQGVWQDSQTLTSFADGDGHIWKATGSWDLSTSPEITNADNCGPPLTAASNGARFVVDTSVWYGAMSAYVRNVAGGQSGLKHGNVFCLDSDNSVFLDYAGNIVSNGVSYGNIIPGGVANNTIVTIQWAQTARVSNITRGSINPAVYPDMLIAKVNGNIVGTFASIMLGTWRGTKRGLCGDIYNVGSGSRPAGANYTLDTSFRSFNWAPDASIVPQNPTTATWNQVTDYNTLTYDQMVRGRQLTTPTLRARLIQYGASDDVWDIDNLSMFVEPLVWSFSNDGGSTFYPAYDIRSNPFGVLSFPPSTVVTSLGRKPGTALVWKVTSYAPDQMVSSLVIRPWYAGLLSGTTHKVGVGTTGPTLMPYDHVPPIEQDPSFQTWSSPIPQSWWYQFRQIQRALSPETHAVSSPLYPGDSVFPGDGLFPA